MKHIVGATIGVASIFLICTFVPGIAEANVLPKTAKLVPPETIFLMDIDDVSQQRQQIKKTNLYKLYKDPAMAAIVEDSKIKRREKIRKVDHKFARAIADADVLPQGRLAVAFVLDNQTKDANETPFLFISQWGQNLIKIKEAVDKMVRKAIEDGAHRKTEDFRGVNITIIIQKSSNTLNYCFIDDCLIGSVNLDILKFVIAHIQGAASPALSDEADYTNTMKAVGPYHDVDFYVNIKQITKTALADDTIGEAGKIVTNLCLDNVTSLGGALGLARGPGGSSTAKALLKINGPKKGIFKMFDIESAALRVPQFIPASAYSVTSINLNIKKAYDEFYNILLSLSPQYAAMMHIPLLPPSPQGEPGLQLKTDIITHLGSQIVIARSLNKPIPGTPTPTETVVAVAVDNRNALEKSLSLLYSRLIAPNNPDARRELLGHTIYLADPSALMPAFKPGKRTPLEITGEERLSLNKYRILTGQAPAKPTAPPMPKLAFTVTDTHLIFGSESTVERIIRTLSSTDAASVASKKWFTTAKSAIPSVVGLAGLHDDVAVSEVFWQTLKKSNKGKKKKDKDSEMQMGIAMSSKSPFPYFIFSRADDLFDPSLLPEFDVVRKYFGLSAFYGISQPDGFFFEFKCLNPPNTD